MLQLSESAFVFKYDRFTKLLKLIWEDGSLYMNKWCFPTDSISPCWRACFDEIRPPFTRTSAKGLSGFIVTHHRFTASKSSFSETQFQAFFNDAMVMQYIRCYQSEVSDVTADKYFLLV